MNPNKKRLYVYIDPTLYEDMADLARKISRARDKRCTKSELAEIALMAFISSFKANVNEDEVNENDNLS